VRIWSSFKLLIRPSTGVNHIIWAVNTFILHPQPHFLWRAESGHNPTQGERLFVLIAREIRLVKFFGFLNYKFNYIWAFFLISFLYTLLDLINPTFGTKFQKGVISGLNPKMTLLYKTKLYMYICIWVDIIRICLPIFRSHMCWYHRLGDENPPVIHADRRIVDVDHPVHPPEHPY
jgi:hypothetical protein